MSNAERLITTLAPIFGPDGREVDDGLLTAINDALEPLAGDELTGEMTADASFSTEFEGAAGLREAWADWLSAFSEVRIELEEVQEVGDSVLTLVNQVGTTRHGVRLSQASAAVWKFRDGVLIRVEFHLDRERARASASEPG
jgi:ketosteroid isomerase-like protein